MDPVTLLVMAGVAFGVNVVCDKVDFLRNITHSRVMSASTEELIKQLKEVQTNPELFTAMVSSKEGRTLDETTCGFNPPKDSTNTQL
jgi:hypothetical protein